MTPLGNRPKAEHHACRNCGRRMAPAYGVEYPPPENGIRKLEPRYDGTIHRYGFDNVFCTKSCAIRYGQRAARVGVDFGELDPLTRPPTRK